MIEKALTNNGMLVHALLNLEEQTAAHLLHVQGVFTADYTADLNNARFFFTSPIHELVMARNTYLADTGVEVWRC